MDAILLVDQHLILFEVEVRDALLKHADHEVVRELVLVGEAGARNGFEPGNKVLVGFVALNDGFE